VIVVVAGGSYGLRPLTVLAEAEEASSTEQPETQIVEGQIAPDQRFKIKDLLAQANIDYAYKQLPDESAAFDGKLYQVVPETIWWHWDGGPTPSATYKDRVFATYNGLAGRTRRGDPVSVQFCAGPGKVLQMLPITKTHIIQGRLTDDRGIEAVREALSFGGIQIETTGDRYGKKAPSEVQTETLLQLTFLLMVEFGIPFTHILGHFERSPVVRKVDPGLKYMKKTRVRLLKMLLEAEEFDLAGPPKGWKFYKLIETKKKTVKVITQTPDEILESLTPAERELVREYFEPEEGAA
jgi:hypothetical protein